MNKTTKNSPMNTTAFQAKDIAKTNTSPLRVLHTTITATIVTRQCLDNGLVARSHLHHDELKFKGSALTSLRILVK